jgi:tricorn protease
VQIVFEGIRNRLTRLQLGLDARDQSISPDGKTLLFIASTGGQDNLYTYSLDDLSALPPVPRQLTSTAGRKSNAQYAPDGKEVFYLEGGRINVIPVDTRVVKPLAVTAEVDVDFDREKKEVFQQAWSTLNEIYYDPKFHGANWAAMREHYAPAIESSRTPDEVRRVISLMIGELNSSHSGISAGPAGTHTPSTGRLGMTVNPADGMISAVTPLGPADVAGIKAGDQLLSIDGVDITPATNIDELLQYKIGRRTVLSTSAKKDIAVLPANTATEKRLLYREWVEGRRAYVDKISGGKLGYVHMVDMSAGSLDQLYLDLDAENQSREGVVIDIRNNTGGFVNAYALDVFARRPYLSMTERDHPTTGARSALGQRSLELPTVLVVNQNSLSDAEDFTEGYRTLKLGKVVGVPTAGWIIYTSGATLIDGSALRTPSVKITAHDGTDMELHPRPVDLVVESPVGEGLAGNDAQLDAAVKTLLGEIGGK